MKKPELKEGDLNIQEWMKKDKRTSDYKEWKERYQAYKKWKQENESKGLGDTIEKITEATGIKKAVKLVFGEDCGCEERKEKLNKKYPFDKINCLEENEYKYLDQFFAIKTNTVTFDQQKKLLKISNRVFNQNKETTTCSSCFKATYDKLKDIYLEYKLELESNETNEV